MAKLFKVGNAEITLVTEMVRSKAPPKVLFPDLDPSFPDENRGWLLPDYMTPDGLFLTMSFHSWLVRAGGHTILIDTGAGSNKERPLNPMLHRLDSSYLENLAEAGANPEDIDLVLLTHLHADHVGWNTRLVDGRWVPTFPNATYVFSRKERDFYSVATNEDAMSAGAYADSVKPVIEMGKVAFIDQDNMEFMDGITFRRTPGHSLDHMSIVLSSQGQKAIFAGDVMHHPLQVYRPAWNSRYCENPILARQTRRMMLEFAAETQALYLGGHYAGGSAGLVVHESEGFSWKQVQATIS
jgi:glyoxylase-like metal-dependent hydrolase (beta-lactamase superfamily II)